MQVAKMNDGDAYITVDQDADVFTVRAYVREDDEPAPLTLLSMTSCSSLSEAMREVVLFWAGEWDCGNPVNSSVYNMIKNNVVVG